MERFVPGLTFLELASSQLPLKFKYTLVHKDFISLLLGEFRNNFFQLVQNRVILVDALILLYFSYFESQRINFIYPSGVS